LAEHQSVIITEADLCAVRAQGLVVERGEIKAPRTSHTSKRARKLKCKRIHWRSIYNDRKKSGLCIQCAEPAAWLKEKKRFSVYCPKHLQYQHDIQKKYNEAHPPRPNPNKPDYYAQLKAEKMCVQCYRHPAEWHEKWQRYLTRCTTCRMVANLYGQAFRARKKAAPG
jgi:hypothetical protein